MLRLRLVVLVAVVQRQVVVVVVQRVQVEDVLWTTCVQGEGMEEDGGLRRRRQRIGRRETGDSSATRSGTLNSVTMGNTGSTLAVTGTRLGTLLRMLGVCMAMTSVVTMTVVLPCNRSSTMDRRLDRRGTLSRAMTMGGSRSVALGEAGCSVVWLARRVEAVAPLGVGGGSEVVRADASFWREKRRLSNGWSRVTGVPVGSSYVEAAEHVEDAGLEVVL